MLQFASFTLRVCIKSVQDVNGKRNHPDAKPLDIEIQSFAKKKLGICQPQNIQVVDDLRSREFAVLWGTTRLGFLSKPVIALEKGLDQVAPSARKYLIIRQLYEASSYSHHVTVAFKIMILAGIGGLIAAGGSFWLVALKIGALLITAGALNSLHNDWRDSSAHNFTLKELSIEDKKEVKALYIAANWLRKDTSLNCLKAPNELAIQNKDEDLLEIFQKAKKIFDKLYEYQDDLRETPLDLSIKLRPNHNKEDFFIKRERYHLENLKINKHLASLESALTVFGLIALAPPVINPVVLFSLSPFVMDPLIEQVHLYITDWLFLRENPQPKNLHFEGIWKGFLSKG